MERRRRASRIEGALRVMAVPLLPALYVVAVALVHLDFLDKANVMVLTLLSIGLLFPKTRAWVARFFEHIPRPPSTGTGRQ